MSILQELQDKIKTLNWEAEGKDLQIRSVENELMEVLSASVSCSETTMLLLQMMAELNLFVQKNGANEKIKASHARLLRLFELNKSLDPVATQNNQLKNINRELHSNYQLLRIQNAELRKKLKDIADAENF